MPQNLVYNANTMDFFRQSINSLAANINLATDTSWGNGGITGNIIVTGKTSSDLAINVANGRIVANGYLLYSLNAISFIGIANNSSLENTSFSIPTQLGLVSNSIVVSLGNTVSINVSPVDSISNNRTDLPASANSVSWALSVARVNIANVTLITSGTLLESRGGTGETTYTDGQVLIGNITSGGLDKTTITAGLGITVTNESGTVRTALNITQGSGISIPAAIGNGAFTVSANGYQVSSIFQSGILSFVDVANSISTTVGVTANAVNSVHSLLANTEPQGNAYGRLLRRDVYTTTGVNGNTRFLWTKVSNSYITRVICVGGGAGSSNAISDGTTSNISVSSGGGSGGAYIGMFSSDVFDSTETVQVGGGGQRANGDYSGFVSGKVICNGGKNIANTKLFANVGSLFRTGVVSNVALGGSVSLSVTPVATVFIQDGEPGQVSGLYGNMLVVGAGGSTIYGTGGQGNVASLVAS